MNYFKNLSTEVLVNKQKIQEEILLNLREQFKKLEKEIMKEVAFLNDINEEIDSRTLNIGDIRSLLEIFPETKTRRELRYNFLSKYHLDCRGYFPNTQQVCIQIKIYKNESDKYLKKIHEGITKLIPFIKPLSDGSKRFSIMEDSLSKYGIFTLVLDSKGKFKIIKTVYSREGDIYINDDLMKILQYIRKNVFITE